MRNSTSWRITAPLRWGSRFFAASVRLLRGRARPPRLRPLTDAAYRRWRKNHARLRPADRAAIRRHIAEFDPPPRLALITVVRDTPAHRLRQSIASLRRQIYPEWRLYLVDDASAAPHVPRMLAAAAADAHIRVVRLGIRKNFAAAANAGLELSDDAMVGFLEPGDQLGETALYEVAALLAREPATAVAYTDEDAADELGRHAAPRFKTGWDPDLLLSHNYLGELTLYRRDLLRQLGGLRAAAGGAERYDLALRATAAVAPATIRHIPAVLYHRRQSAGDDPAAARRILSAHLAERGQRATVSAAPDLPQAHRVLWTMSSWPTVSVIVPSRDRPDLLERCLAGVLEQTDYPTVEVIVVDNDSQDARLRSLYARLSDRGRVRVLAFPEPFNWSRMNNAGAEAASGEVLVLLNNDIAVTERGWLRELAAQAARPEIGAVGAKLLFPDGRVQHAGVWLGAANAARHLLRLSPGNAPGYLGQLATARNLSAVTGACLALRRAVFREVGGLDQELAVAFNDVDLCLRIIDLGYRVLWTPHARLIHLESASRGGDQLVGSAATARAELEYLRRKWGSRLDEDPFLNPNLDLIGEETLALAAPPRRQPPWARYR
ncbi:MAG: glycosyltransferase family 2 protein [Alphaproteobacteria bacterium]|nr:glycosyltransferase family 2 protein [Alphaproteobacteria bacterium]